MKDYFIIIMMLSFITITSCIDYYDKKNRIDSANCIDCDELIDKADKIQKAGQPEEKIRWFAKLDAILKSTEGKTSMVKGHIANNSNVATLSLTERLKYYSVLIRKGRENIYYLNQQIQDLENNGVDIAKELKSKLTGNQQLDQKINLTLAFVEKGQVEIFVNDRVDQVKHYVDELLNNSKNTKTINQNMSQIVQQLDRVNSIFSKAHTDILITLTMLE